MDLEILTCKLTLVLTAVVAGNWLLRTFFFFLTYAIISASAIKEIQLESLLLLFITH